MQEISRFSCMLFLSVRGFSDYAGPTDPLAIIAAAVLPSSLPERSRHPDPSAFRSSIARPTDTSVYASSDTSRCSPARLEARMDSLLSFPVGLFHPLQHAGLSRRTPICRRFDQGAKLNVDALFQNALSHNEDKRRFPYTRDAIHSDRRSAAQGSPVKNAGSVPGVRRISMDHGRGHPGRRRPRCGYLSVRPLFPEFLSHVAPQAADPISRTDNQGCWLVFSKKL